MIGIYKWNNEGGLRVSVFLVEYEKSVFTNLAGLPVGVHIKWLYLIPKLINPSQIISNK
jgi:hypothetical protein